MVLVYLESCALSPSKLRMFSSFPKAIPYPLAIISHSSSTLSPKLLLTFFLSYTELPIIDTYIEDMLPYVVSYNWLFFPHSTLFLRFIQAVVSISTSSLFFFFFKFPSNIPLDGCTLYLFSH